MLVPSIFGENLLDGFFDDDWMRPGRTGRPSPIPHNLLMKTDIKETEGGFDLAIELPGYTKEDVQAELKDGYMTITATKKDEKDEKDDNGKYIRRERRSSSYQRSFRTPGLKPEDIIAQYKNGVLTVNIPKKEAIPEKEEAVKIEVKD